MTKRILLTAAVAAITFTVTLAQAPAATVFEGARVIVGDGRVIENATFVMQGDRITQVGAAAAIKAPTGATPVSLAGKTVMPAIVDAHVHTSTTQPELATDLRQRAQFGVGAALGMGLDGTDAPFAQRAQTTPGLARLYLAGRGITAPEKGRTEVPHWITTEAETRKAVQDEAAKKVDLIKIWVDDRDGKFPKLTPALYGPVIDEAHKRKLRVAAHIFSLADAKELLKAGVDAFAHGIRDRDIDDEIVAMFKERKNVVLIPNMPDRGVAAETIGNISGV
jgi:imidazolonepropionase-like amidohydrolase